MYKKRHRFADPFDPRNLFRAIYGYKKESVRGFEHMSVYAMRIFLMSTDWCIYPKLLLLLQKYPHVVLGTKSIYCISFRNIFFKGVFCNAILLTITKAQFTQVKFFNGYPSNYILKIYFWLTINVNFNVKWSFHLYLVMPRLYFWNLSK